MRRSPSRPKSKTQSPRSRCWRGGVRVPAGGYGDHIGGSIANNDPAADYPAACLALGATIVTNKREIAADNFFTGLFETALGADEMILRVAFPEPGRAGYAK